MGGMGGWGHGETNCETIWKSYQFQWKIDHPKGTPLSEVVGGWWGERMQNLQGNILFWKQRTMARSRMLVSNMNMFIFLLLCWLNEGVHYGNVDHPLVLQAKWRRPKWKCWLSFGFVSKMKVSTMKMLIFLWFCKQHEGFHNEYVDFLLFCKPNEGFHYENVDFRLVL